MCHICEKGFLNSNFNWAIIDKISNFLEIAPNFTYSQKLKYMYYSNFLDQLRLLYQFYGRGMKGIYFSILPVFCQLWAVKYCQYCI